VAGWKMDENGVFIMVFLQLFPFNLAFDRRFSIATFDYQTVRIAELQEEPFLNFPQVIVATEQTWKCRHSSLRGILKDLRWKNTD